MAYIKFCVIAVETSLKSQSVYITFNKEIDEDSLTLQNIILAFNGQGTAPLANFDIILGKDLKTLQLKFIDAPVVNQPYVLILQDKIKDLEGNNLDKSLLRTILFKSSVTSDIILNSPANFEIITEQRFSWSEKGDSLVHSYRLQVSSDTGFHNLLIDSAIKDQTEVIFGASLEPGQYYYRVRAEQEEMFGVWSETRTFLVQQGNEYEEQEISNESSTTSQGDDIIIEDLVHDIKDERITIEEIPKNGITPSSFSFLFSEPINPDSIKISIIRSDF